MGDTNLSPSMTGLNSEVAAISAKIMVTSMIVLFFLVTFCLFLCLYAKWYWSRAEYPSAFPWRTHTARQGTPSTVGNHRQGLDRDTLKALPVVVYDVKDFKEALECSVCISEISNGENVRVLPKCSHGFHLECIDMWFMSHSTCPLCRNYVISSPKTRSTESNHESQEVGVTRISPDSGLDSDLSLNSAVTSEESIVSSTNVLFRGNEGQVESVGEASGLSARRREELVIEIPLSTNPFSEEEVKTPVVSRLGSLKRMLSRGKRVAPSSSINVEPV
ncbi:hypothetical protein RND81_05G240000 [Saponaria officinalis]|uniref:RING-type E3 ubiquitin transferase n=1 Tax=Saponaria officinalis TaxID=3572 RepID=A0AAW1L3B2_SAPOF